MTIPRLSIYTRLPLLDLFSWPVYEGPELFPPTPPRDSKWLQPFTIPPSLFHKSCDIRVPFTIVAVYLTSVIYLNHVNEVRQNRPWGFANTSSFKYLVVFHNIFLALLSGCVLYGGLHSFRKCLPSTTDPNFLVHVANTLCRSFSLDETPSPNTFLDQKIAGVQLPLPPGSGCLYTNGCVYFSWIYYIMKFYEVVDTSIILAKGKKVSILHAHHHSSVIFCGWAAAQFRSPPTLVGTFLNSVIHTLLYSYFAWTALSLPVFAFIKQILTALQIAQFLVGAVLGWAYLFIEYDTLIYRPEGQVGGLPLTTTGSKGVSYFAQTIPSDPEGSMFRSQIQNPQDRFQVRKTACLRSRRETFQIWATTLFLLPLVYLFVCFFRRTYLKRVKHHTK